MIIEEYRGDIRVVKRGLREEYKQKRQRLTPEQKKVQDDAVIARFCQTPQYKRAKTVLLYISTAAEIDTSGLLNRAMSDGKKIAAPLCTDGEGQMEFYIVDSPERLIKGRFGVLEPDPEVCEGLRSFDESICVVPGLAFDRQGFRLGYGKGYYDRFLSGYPGVKLGLCYCSCLAVRLPRGRYDVPVEYIVTEKFTKKV